MTENDAGASDKATLQLKRLETLTDVVFALVLWRLFTLLPSPGQEDWGWRSMTEFVHGELSTFVSVTIGLAFTIIYWLQSNVLLGDLLLGQLKRGRAVQGRSGTW